ncbi:MAG: hypothetical protein ACK5TU_03320, partial [Cyclobacteriaceae bacterium]
LVLGKNKLFDFVVGKNKFFTIETTANPTDALKIEDYLKTIVVKNDEDNKLFFDNLHFIGQQSLEAEPLIKVLRDSTLTEDQKKDARASFSKIIDRVRAYKNVFI